MHTNVYMYILDRVNHVALTGMELTTEHTGLKLVIPLPFPLNDRGISPHLAKTYLPDVCFHYIIWLVDFFVFCL